ncbi:nuclear transport factor 2 family protein [Nonomuraea thailandensis]|uniref:nuclear transport factor 2 family protein n=1 Tax=Nonomuraea thailandensis TaxID=1188745 RepID=UPI0020A40351
MAATRLDLKGVIAEGDLVMLHHHLTPAGEERGVAVVDIWRLVDGQIAEHWDVVQPVPDPARHVLGRSAAAGGLRRSSHRTP